MPNTTAALLQVIDAAGEAVLTLTESLEQSDFCRSRLTKPEVHRQLCLMADTLLALPAWMQQAMPELDVAGWGLARRDFDAAAPEARDRALWFAVRSQVPAALSWLRVYRQSQPALFRY